MNVLNEAQHALPAAAETIEQAQQKLQEKLSDYDGKLRDFVSEHPIAAVAGALAVGYLLGRLLSRL